MEEPNTVGQTQLGLKQPQVNIDPQSKGERGGGGSCLKFSHEPRAKREKKLRRGGSKKKKKENNKKTRKGTLTFRGPKSRREKKSLFLNPFRVNNVSIMWLYVILFKYF